MKTKIETNYRYEGLGFPVYIDEVEFVEYNGEYHPKIDVVKVSESVIRKLANQKSRFTGNQVKFIRSYFEMSLRDFGDMVVRESHAAVRKWEKRGNEPTNMNSNTEQALRLYILAKAYGRQKFYDRYLEINEALESANENEHQETVQVQGG